MLGPRDGEKRLLFPFSNRIVTCVEISTSPGSEKIKSGVRDVCVGLQRACPSVINDEFRRLVAVDPMFTDLIVPNTGTQPVCC